MHAAAVGHLFQRYGQRYKWYATGTVVLGTTAMVLATTIVNVAIPDIMATFRMGQVHAQWLSSGFLVAMAATMLMTSWCVDAFGQRRTYMGALFLFIAASLMGGASATADLVILSRILQGAAAGVIQPLGMITISQVFPPDQRGRAMAIYGIGIVLAPALGPAIGGIMVNYVSWRAVFLVPLPLCLAGTLLAPFFIVRRNGEGRWPSFDWSALALLSLFMLSFLTFFSQQHRPGWASEGIPASLTVAIISVCAFLWWELRSSRPLLDMRIFSRKRFAAASLVALTYGMGLYGSTYLIPLFVQTVAGYTPTDSGLLLIPAGVVLGCAIFMGGLLTDRYSASLVVMVGLTCFALSFLLMAGATDTTPFWTLAGWISIGRIGIGLMLSSLYAGAIQTLEVEFLNQGAGAISFIRQLGAAFGVNLLSIFLKWRTLGYSGLITTSQAAGNQKLWVNMFSLQARLHAFQDGFKIVALVSVIALLPAWYMRPKRSN